MSSYVVNGMENCEWVKLRYRVNVVKVKVKGGTKNGNGNLR
jgi:hypothetical protein